MKAKIGKRSVDALEPEGGHKAILWDTELIGFGVAAHPGGARVYLLRYFHNGRDRRMTLGRHGELTPDQARRLAAQRLAEVRAGRDPLAERQEAREAAGSPQTVAWLVDEYVTARTAADARPRPWKASTEREARRILAAEVKTSRLGRKALREVTGADVERWHGAFMHREKPAPYAANRALAWLSGAFRHAVRKGLRPDNPCASVTPFAEESRDRAFTLPELARIGAAMEKVATGGPGAALAMEALTLLALTGLRRDNVLRLRWDEVNLPERMLELADTKGGKRVKGLGPEALALLERRQERRRDGEEHVFPSRRKGPLRDIRKHIDAVFVEAKIQGATAHHVWRHTFASQAGELGYSDLVVGALLGHSKRTVTSRYVKLDSVLRDAEERVQARIAAALFRRPPADVVPLRDSGKATS